MMLSPKLAKPGGPQTKPCWPNVGRKVDTSSWRKFKVKVVRHCDNILSAREALSKHVDNSTYETEPERGRGLRKRKARRFSSESEEEAPSRRRGKKIALVNSSSDSDDEIPSTNQRFPAPPPVPVIPPTDASTLAKKVIISTSRKKTHNAEENSVMLEKATKTSQSGVSGVKARLEKAKQALESAKEKQQRPQTTVQERFQQLRDQANAKKLSFRKPAKHPASDAGLLASTSSHNSPSKRPEENSGGATHAWTVSPLKSPSGTPLETLSPFHRSPKSFSPNHSRQLFPDHSSDLSGTSDQTSSRKGVQSDPVKSFGCDTHPEGINQKSTTSWSVSPAKSDSGAGSGVSPSSRSSSTVPIDNSGKRFSELTDRHLMEECLSLSRRTAANLDILSSKVDILGMNQSRLNRALLPEEKRIKRPPNLPSFPLKSKDEFNAMENFLSEDLNFAATVDYLETKISSKDSEKKATGSLLRHVMTNALSGEFNFDGTGEKSSFSSSKLWDVIQGCLLRKDPDSELVQSLIEVKNWLKNAPWRKQEDGSYGKRGESYGKKGAASGNKEASSGKKGAASGKKGVSSGKRNSSQEK